MLVFLLGTLVGCGSEIACGEGTHLAGEECVADTPVEDRDSGGDSVGRDTEVSDSGGTHDSMGSDSALSPDDTDTGVTGIPKVRPARVYLLSGQSNMVGLGQVTALPASLRSAQTDVEFFGSDSLGWRSLEPSSDYSSGYSVYMGPEVTFGRTLADAQPDERIFLIKHAVGGTALANYWVPGETPDDPYQGAGYKDFVATVVAGLAALDERGEIWEVAGMIWMQGESDAADASFAAEYQTNLSHFISRVREDVGVSELPFSLGLIDCLGVCAYRETVREAQVAVAEADASVHWLETEDLGLYHNDYWHYHGLAQRTLGERFAESLLGKELSDLSIPAIVLDGGYTTSYYGNYTTGWSFHVSEAVMITDFGLFDVGMDGLNQTAEIGIWDAETESLLYRESIPGASSADTAMLDGFRYVGVEPILLEPGDYLIGAQAFYENYDFYAYDAPISTHDSVTWLEGRHSNGSSLYFPDIDAGGSQSAALWFGPNFRVEPVPE